MLAIGENNVEPNFIIKYDKNNNNSQQIVGPNIDPNENQYLRNKNSWSFIYVNIGFFDLVLWPMLPFMILGHLVHFYGLYLIFIEQKYWGTFFISSLFMLWAGFGVTAGSHRLWCHRSYEARIPLRIFLMMGHTMSGQVSPVLLPIFMGREECLCYRRRH